MGANAVGPAPEFLLQSENHIPGSCGDADPDTGEFDFVDAGRAFIKLRPSAAIFDCADSFGMMRPGPLDFAVLERLHVSEKGRLANCQKLYPEFAPSVGGAMGLSVGAQQVFTAMAVFDHQGHGKLLNEC